MTEKINVAEILKSKPVGTMLYDKARNISVYLEDVAKGANGCYGITCTFGTDRVQKLYYSHKGTLPFFENGIVILLPSKKMCNWEKFNWKKGDVLVSNDSDSHIIFKGFSKNNYTTFEGKYWISASKKRYVSCLNMQNVQDYHIEDNKDAAQTYINTIEEKLDGKLNRKTLEIEKIFPELYDGDIAFADYGNIQDIFIVSGRTFSSDGYTSFISLNLNRMTLSMGCKASFFEKDLSELRLATEEEKQQLFDALAKENKVWDTKKKMIVDLKPKVELKPFDKVLVRNRNTHRWEADLFGFKSEGYDTDYHCVSSIWKFCIPYIGNESLLGTIKNVEG